MIIMCVLSKRDSLLNSALINVGNFFNTFYFVSVKYINIFFKFEIINFYKLGKIYVHS